MIANGKGTQRSRQKFLIELWRPRDRLLYLNVTVIARQTDESAQRYLEAPVISTTGFVSADIVVTVKNAGCYSIGPIYAFIVRIPRSAADDHPRQMPTNRLLPKERKRPNKRHFLLSVPLPWPPVSLASPPRLRVQNALYRLRRDDWHSRALMRLRATTRYATQ